MKPIFLIIISCLISISIVAQNMPIIGVSSTAEAGVASAPLTYINAIKRAGGVPLIIPITVNDAQLESILAVIDGLVMTGGEDVDPLKYFGEEPIPMMGKISPERDAFDYKLIRLAVERNIPLLGICRGMQVLNVAMGGSLYQDIPSQVVGHSVLHKQKTKASYPTHSIEISKNSILYTILDIEKIPVNSFHHQSVKELGEGLVITALSKDGIIEAIEDPTKKCLIGVQFHPESLSIEDDRFLAIFKYLVERSKSITEG